MSMGLLTFFIKQFIAYLTTVFQRKYGNCRVVVLTQSTTRIALSVTFVVKLSLTACGNVPVKRNVVPITS